MDGFLLDFLKTIKSLHCLQVCLDEVANMSEPAIARQSSVDVGNICK